MKDKKRTGIVILVASLLLAVIFMYAWMVFQQARRQTWDLGISQLELISNELEEMMTDAENLTLELALSAGELMDDREALEEFIYEERDRLIHTDNGIFNVYVAGEDFMIIPGFDPSPDYVLQDRIWYSGALKNNGKAYVTPPYQDAITQNICYSATVKVGDENTVLGVDYVMDNIKNHITHLYEAGTHNAVIVTGEGIIAGCADDTLIGEKLVTALPDYAGVWSLSKSSSGVATARIRSGLLNEYLFATRSGTGWYLIVSESEWDLYRDSYIQLFITIILSFALFGIVIILYVFALNSQKKTEEALRSKEEFLNRITGDLREPLSTIMHVSDRDYASQIEDYGSELSRIHRAGADLSEMIDKILSFSSIVRTESKKDTDISHAEKGAMNRRFRTLITLLMIFVMLVSLYVNIYATTRWGNQMMHSKADEYEYRLSEWIDTQKSILDMFVSIISTHPEMLDDYDGTIDYLNRITAQYPEISVTYLSNPDLEPSVYMNNGWKPEPGWRVEERPWYKDTTASAEGWSISAPYYDDQTGGYCITISETVYDARNGTFLGCFGIDFYMDKLVGILGDSYSDEGYAFLVDTEGDIINHPYGIFQMSGDAKTNIADLPYGKAKPDGESIKLFRDYDGVFRIMTANYNEVSKFTVFVVSDVRLIYGRVAVYGLICIAAFLFCIIMVYRLLSSLIRWQDETNQQMRDAADAAMAAGKAKSQFLAQMSHEIRTPINAVLGMNEMILRESDDADILEYSGNIKSAGKTLLSIINSILDFSKIEDGKMEITPVKYDTAPFISNLENSISERANAKALDFIIDVDESLPSALFGDDVRLGQVIVNLLTNAVKYTEKGSVTLSIQNGGIEGDDITISVSVSDTGIGIREEDRERLFESFERLDEKRNRNIEGTGLGMSIVTKLLAMMDSELKVESVYGEGSVFSFDLKQGIEDPKPLGNYRERMGTGREEGVYKTVFHAPDARVLVVDDNQMNLKVAKNLLKLNGIEADLALSGYEAIDMAGKKKYDLIFLDHMMPRMDGIETLNKMRSEGVTDESTKVIALTANAVVGSRELYMEAGFDDYLTKPIDVEQLDRMLARHLPERMREGSRSAKEIPVWESDKDTGKVMPCTDEMLQKLEEAGISTKTGLAYCANDREIYAEVLEEYAKDHGEKSRLLAQYYEEQSWDEYRIIIHSLKSSSKTIGGEKASALAKELEDASGKKDTEFITEHHDEFMKLYDDLVNTIKPLYRTTD